MTVHSLIVTPMSPRPRETTDDAILEATYRAMSQHGPARLTLAHVAREVGVAPATLMQRFGSKRGLLLALARQSARTTGQQYAAIRAAHRSPLAALFAVAECMAGLAPTPEALANNLAYLHVDLTDADFHEIALQQARAARGEVRAILDAAVAARELTPCDTARLARLVGVLLGGGLLAWAVERDATAAEWLRDDLEALLAPYRKRKSSGSVRARHGERKSKGRR
jgi:AcrR family transcriptional regulator